MDLKDIMAIAGKPGLYKFVAQGRNAIIVENIETGKRTSAFSTERINSLKEISVFTNEKDIPLEDIFKSIFDTTEGKECIFPKSDVEELKAYFEEIVPDYDKSRVYVSDIKKILLWYNLLLKHDMLSFEEETETVAEGEKKADSQPENNEEKKSEEEKPKKKA